MPQAVKKRRNAYLFGSLLLFAFLFSYYFFVYIPSRERQMDERGIRLMNQMARSTAERLDHYDKSIDLFRCEYFGQGLVQSRKPKESSYELIARFFELEMDCGVIIDSIYSIYDRRSGQTDVIDDAFYDQILKEFSALVVKDPSIQLVPIADSAYYIVLDRYELGNRIDNTSIGLGISTNDLVKTVKRFDYFDDIVLTRPEDGKVLDQSRLDFQYLTYAPEEESKIDVGDENLNNALDEKDEVIEKSTEPFYRIPNVDITEVKIAGRSYLCFTKLIKLNGQAYYLNGMLEKDRYYASVREVSIWTVLIAILVLLFLVQLLPIVKPFILSKKERLQGGDLTWGAVAMIFGTSVVTLLLIAVDTFSIEEIELVDQKLQKHAIQTQADFQKDINTTLVDIKHAALFYNAKVANADSNVVFDRKLKPKMRFLRINESGMADYFRIDAATKKLVIFNKDVNLAHRAYYLALKGSSPIDAWKSQNGDSEYYVASILSLSTGMYETVVAIKNSDGFIYASVSPLSSVNQRYLEPGYTFSVISRDGTIQYDSDESRIGTENFIAETDGNKNFQSLLANRSSKHSQLRFSLKGYRAFVQPLANTPWFIVAKFDITKSRLNIAQAMAVTFQIILFLLFYLFILHWLHKMPFVLSNHGKLGDFSYLFLSPVNASSRVYWSLAGFNVFYCLLLFGVYAGNELNLQLNVAVYFSMITQAILINYTLLKRYGFIQNSGAEKVIYGLNPFEWGLSIFWLFWMIITRIQIPKEIWFDVMFIVQLAVMVLYGYIKINSPLTHFFTEANSREQKTFNAFYAHTFSWVSMLGIVGCFLFFKPVYNQIHIKRAFANWVEEYDYRNQNYVLADNKVNLFAADKSTYEKLNDVEVANSFLDKITLYFEDDAELLYGQTAGAKTIRLNVMEAIDTASGLPFFELEMDKKSHRKNTVQMSNNTIVAFALPSLDHAKKPAQTIVFWAIIVLLLFGLATTIVQLSQKYFYLGIMKRLRIYAKVRDKELEENAHNIASVLHPQQPEIMLVGPPSSGRNTIAKSWFKNAKAIFYIDFLNEIEAELAKLTEDVLGKPMVINNFDHRSDDFELDMKKLEVIEKLVRYRNEKQVKHPLIIIAHCGSDQLIQKYVDRIEYLAAAKAPQEEIENVREAMHRWQAIMYDFVIHMVPLSLPNTDDFIENELRIGYALPRFIPQIAHFHNKLIEHSPEIKDADLHQKLINTIIEAAQNYYYAIWNACSPAEKLLIYDLAQDGLVNTKNEAVMSDLVQKGLLRTEPTLRLFNQSFTQFILQNIPEEDGIRMERDAKSQGIWGTYQIIVVLMIFAILVFLSFAEKEAMARIAGILTLAATLLPRLIEFTGKIGNPKGWFSKSG
jgi:hypothetical protein